MATEELRLLIRAEADKAVSNLRKYQGEARKSEQSTKKLGNTLQNAKRNWIAVAGAVTAAVLAIKGAARALRGAWDAAKLAAEVSQVSRSFNKLAESAGLAGREILADLKELSAGTISELDLMRAAARASIYGIPMERLARLMEIARASATALALDTTDAFDRLVSGIGKGSAEVLDDLGIKATGAVERFARAIGKSSTELSNMERQQALLNTVLEQGAVIIENMGDVATEFTSLEKWQNMRAEMKNLRSEIGISLLGTFEALNVQAAGFFKQIRDYLMEQRTAKDIMAGLFSVRTQSEAQAAMDTLGTHMRSLMRDQRRFAEEGTTAWDVWQEKVDEVAREYYKFMQLIKTLPETTAPAPAGLIGEGGTVLPGGGISPALLRLQQEYAKTIEGRLSAVQEYIAVVRAFDEGPMQEAVLKLYREQEQVLLAKLAVIEELPKPMEEAAESAIVMRDMLSESLDITQSLYGAYKRLAEASREDVKEMAKDAAIKILIALAVAGITGQMGGARTHSPVNMGGALSTVLGAVGLDWLANVVPMQQGGVVTKPTLAMIGERGPEAVVPLGKGGAGGITINQYINGSVWQTRQLQALAVGAVAQVARAY